MTEMVVFVGGGFGGASRERMSPSLRLRCEMADAAFDQQAARVERERAELRAQDEDKRIRASIELAVDRGEIFDVREAVRNGGIGHTRAEMVALASSRMDWEDARQAGLQAKWVQDKCNEAWYGDTSADTSAPSFEEVQEAAELADRAARITARRRRDTKLIRTAVRLSAMERGVQ
ncbi:MAG: hypothetical protein ACJ74U_20095 [Jatrophihabitantaceae bacterium]